MMFYVVFVFFPYFVGFERKEINSINSNSKHMNCAKLLKIWPLCTILTITLSSKLGLRHGQVRWKEDSERNKSSSKSFFIQGALERPKWRSSAMARWRAGNERQRWRAASIMAPNARAPKTDARASSCAGNLRNRQNWYGKRVIRPQLNLGLPRVHQID